MVAPGETRYESNPGVYCPPGMATPEGRRFRTYTFIDGRFKWAILKLQGFNLKIMPGTLGNVIVHIVWSTKNRKNLLVGSVRDECQKWLLWAAKDKNVSVLEFFVRPDHVHLLVVVPLTIPISEFVGHIKRTTSRFVNKVHGNVLRWQTGYGIFSVSESHVERVTRYIQNQDEHHKSQSFEGEFVLWLKKSRISYDDRYLFDEE